MCSGAFNNKLKTYTNRQYNHNFLLFKTNLNFARSILIELTLSMEKNMFKIKKIDTVKSNQQLYSSQWPVSQNVILDHQCHAQHAQT